jgi:hypothetical protein
VPRRRPVARCLLAIAAVATLASGASAVRIIEGDPVAVAARDPWLRPFRSGSIWNMPIGSGAVYADAGLPRAGAMALDKVILRQLSASDPARPLVRPGSWTNRCSGTIGTGVSVNIPDGWIVPDAYQRADGGWTTPNNVAALLLPDGRTLLNTNAVARCSAGGPVFGWQTGNAQYDRTDLYGDGRFGSHGASRLSGIGGAIRPGELSGSAPITHALDLLVWAKFLSYTNGGFRWPAAAADSYAASAYTGTRPETRMGSLLALAPALTPESLGISTAVGRKLFAAMQDYGGYITDDSAWDANYMSVDAAAVGTFSWGAAEQEDMRRIIDAASVVMNNSATSIGGGGTPRQPLLPELVPPGTTTTVVPTTTTPPPTTAATTTTTTTTTSTTAPPTATTTSSTTTTSTTAPTTTVAAPTTTTTVPATRRNKPKRRPRTDADRLGISWGRSRGRTG